MAKVQGGLRLIGAAAGGNEGVDRPHPLDKIAAERLQETLHRQILD